MRAFCDTNPGLAHPLSRDGRLWAGSVLWCFSPPLPYLIFTSCLRSGRATNTVSIFSSSYFLWSQSSSLSSSSPLLSLSPTGESNPSAHVDLIINIAHPASHHHFLSFLPLTQPFSYPSYVQGTAHSQAPPREELSSTITSKLPLCR